MKQQQLLRKKVCHRWWNWVCCYVETNWKRVKATVASPDDVRVVLYVVHPVDVKIEKGTEDREGDNSESAGAGGDI